MKKENAAPESQDSANQCQSDNSAKVSGKLESMMLRFAQGKKYHRFSAETIGDHCLPTTISDLQKRHGIVFSRKLIKVPNRFGTKTSVMLYWLEGISLTKARMVCQLDKAA
jgi:hypothetical protein